MNFKETSFSDLVGKKITQVSGMEHGSELVTITTECGHQYRMHHDQNCCESVRVEDVCGDPSALVGGVVLSAECSESEENPPQHEYVDSYTWTFYRLATFDTTVVLRWLGESNGYYSESVDFEVARPEPGGE